MKISRFNHEGYPDPTVFAAFTNIEAELRKARFRPIVYVCSPYSGDIEANILNARRYCRFAVDRGCIPIAARFRIRPRRVHHRGVCAPRGRGGGSSHPHR